MYNSLIKNSKIYKKRFKNSKSNFSIKKKMNVTNILFYGIIFSIRWQRNNIFFRKKYQTLKMQFDTFSSENGKPWDKLLFSLVSDFHNASGDFSRCLTELWKSWKEFFLIYCFVIFEMEFKIDKIYWIYHWRKFKMILKFLLNTWQKHDSMEFLGLWIFNEIPNFLISYKIFTTHS